MPPEAASNYRRDRAAPAGRWRVMLVDDDPECGDMMRTALERKGIDVTFHAGAMAALAEFRQHPGSWDALVTDQMMPGMKGLDLVRAIKGLRADLPCVLCTGYAKDIEQGDMRAPGVAAFLRKPVEIGQVVETLAAVIDQPGAFIPPPPRRPGNRVSGLHLSVAVPSSVGDLRCEIADIAPIGIFATDAAGICVYANAQMLSATGLSRLDVLGHDWAEAMYPDDSALALAAWAEAVRSARPFRHEFCLRDAGGGETWLYARAVPRLDGDGRMAGFVGTVTDASKRRGAQARLEFLSHHDSLTGLPNRMLARDRLRQAISFAGRGQFRVALVLVDIDHFKDVNDSFGHSVGDAVLTATAERLEGCVRDSDTVSRTGGDEFLLILTDIHDPDAVAAVAAKILQQLAAPLEIDGAEIRCSVSAGISVYPDDGSEFDALLGKADTALDQAKGAGRNAYRFYTERMNVDAIRQLDVRNQLHRALERGEFVLYYQPVVSLASGRVAGAEALIRWKHPSRGLVPPNDFISIAEDSGLIVPIGEWALREACRQAAAWRQSHLPALFVAVNLSAVQFRRGDLERTVAAALADSGLPPALLELELTESILIADSDNVLATVRRLCAHGVRLSIDDFGTGYSSLSYLKRFSVHKLKIDRSFVAEAHKDSGDAAIVGAVIQMARAMNLEVVAEGVEQAETLDFLRSLRCDLVQGYIYGRPVPADEFPLVLTSATDQLEFEGADFRP